MLAGLKSLYYLEYHKVVQFLLRMLYKILTELVTLSYTVDLHVAGDIEGKRRL